MKKILKITLILANVLLFAPFLKADFCLSIGGKSSVKDSIVVKGGGNNYYNKSLSELLADESYKEDKILHSFRDLLKSFQAGTFEKDRIDAMLLIKKDTSFDDIICRYAVCDGDTTVMYTQIKSDEQSYNFAYTPFAFKNGTWQLDFSILKARCFADLMTLATENSIELTNAQIGDYKKFIESLDLSKSKLLSIKITKEGATIQSYAFLSYTFAGEQYDEIKVLFKDISNSYKSGNDKDLYAYLGEQEAESFKLIKEQNTKVPTPIVDSVLYGQVTKFKDDYEIFGYSEIGDLKVVYVSFGEAMRPFFIRKNKENEYKLVCSSAFGKYSQSLLSFFQSMEFLKALNQ